MKGSALLINKPDSDSSITYSPAVSASRVAQHHTRWWSVCDQASVSTKSRGRHVPSSYTVNRAAVKRSVLIIEIHHKASFCWSLGLGGTIDRDFWLWIKYAVRLGGWKRERSAYEFAWKRSMKDVKPDPRWQGQCLSVVYTWRETALSVGMTSDSFRVRGANLAASPRFREERVTWSVTESTSLFNYRAQRGPWMTNTDWKRCHFSASAEFHPTC